MNNYDETIEYWDKVFVEVEEYNPIEKIQVEEAENAISWLVENSKSTIDFGCGNGRVIFRCLNKGMEYVYGVDICNNAIDVANSIIKNLIIKIKLM